MASSPPLHGGRHQSLAMPWHRWEALDQGLSPIQQPTWGEAPLLLKVVPGAQDVCQCIPVLGISALLVL